MLLFLLLSPRSVSGNTHIHQPWTLLNYFLKNKLPKYSKHLDSTFPMKTFLPAKLDRETLLLVFLSWSVGVLTDMEDKIALAKRKWELFT